MANLLAAQLIPRLGTAEDIAAAVAYLASEASSFMTAQTLVIDGGLSAHVPVMSPQIAVPVPAQPGGPGVTAAARPES